MLSINTEKALALKLYNDEPFFTINDAHGEPTTAYEGTEDEARTEYAEALETGYAETFEQWCAENLTEVAEYEEYGDYMVLTDDEADEKAKEYILNSVWAFNPSFLSEQTGIDEEVFSAIQSNGKCESNNDAILSTIKDEDDFVRDAIRADGRGHFLSSYDGEETEQDFEGTTYYIYRIN